MKSYWNLQRNMAGFWSESVGRTLSEHFISLYADDVLLIISFLYHYLTLQLESCEIKQQLVSTNRKQLYPVWPLGVGCKNKLISTEFYGLDPLLIGCPLQLHLPGAAMSSYQKNYG